MKNGYHKNRRGFSLLEVMIALMVFAFFVASYIAAEGFNVDSSANMRKELKLQQLATETINTIIINPPKLDSSLTLTSETKKFEREGLEDYEYSLTWALLEIPDLNSIQGNDSSEDNSNTDDGAASLISKKIFKEIQNYVKKKLWQLEVTVTDTTSGHNFTLSTWIADPEVQAELRL